MFDTIRRVISGDNVAGEDSVTAAMDTTSNNGTGSNTAAAANAGSPMEGQEDQQSPAAAMQGRTSQSDAVMQSSSATSPALIETEQHDEDGHDDGRAPAADAHAPSSAATAVATGASGTTQGIVTTTMDVDADDHDKDNDNDNDNDDNDEGAINVNNSTVDRNAFHQHHLHLLQQQRRLQLQQEQQRQHAEQAREQQQHEHSHSHEHAYAYAHAQQQSAEIPTSGEHHLNMHDGKAGLGFPTGASSLSTVSTHDDNGGHSMKDMTSIVGQDALQVVADGNSKAVASRVGFHRNDSRVSNDSSSESNRASSQTSSRDWGWFEDVHMSEHHHGSPFLKRKDQPNDKAASHKKGRQLKGLVPPSASISTHIEDIFQPNMRTEEDEAMAVTAPTYVLEESLSSQMLWNETAGTRPPQPAEERAFFEKMWAQNFEKSEVDYQMPVEVLTAASPESLCPYTDGNFDTSQSDDLARHTMTNDSMAIQGNDATEATLLSRLNDPTVTNYATIKKPAAKKTVKGTGNDGDLVVLVREDNKFGTAVSKSFVRSNGKGGPIIGIDTVNISVGSYRVVESKKHGKYAQFLVIYREGSVRDTIGVWKRYSDFVELSKKVTQTHEGCAAVIANISPLAVTEEHEVEHLPNAITSWRLLKKNQRWYRCFDSSYLGFKAFFLERFLHDILFESSSPNLLRDFVGASRASNNNGNNSNNTSSSTAT